MPYALIVHRFTCSFCKKTHDEEIPYFQGQKPPRPSLPWEAGTAGWTHIVIGSSEYLVCPDHNVNMQLLVDGNFVRPSDPTLTPLPPKWSETWHLRKGQWISVPNELHDKWGT